MRQWILCVVIGCLSSSVYAESSSLNLALPSGPMAYGQDRIRSGDLDCSNAIGGGTNLEFGVTGIVNGYRSPFDGGSDANTNKDVGVYARITIPLDGPKQRVNCNSLYELELRKKRLEVLKLEEELRKLREMKFEN